jgi:hypothetical protein
MPTHKFVALCFSILFALIGVVVLLGLFGRTSTVSADPATRYVATSGDDSFNICTDSGAPCRTVQHAVDTADPGDSIDVATGVYTDVHGRQLPPNYVAPPSVNTIYQVVYITKTVSVQGGYTTDFSDPPDPQANPTTLDAQGTGRAMIIAGNFSPTIAGLRLTGGNAYGLGGGINNNGGGGLYIIDASAVFSKNVVYDNRADSGGGIFLENSTSTLSENEIFSNTAQYFGGGMLLNHSAASLIGNKINSNEATSNIGSGAGIYTFYSSATINGNTIYSNVAKSNGGGINLNTSPDATLVENIIISNTANTGHGGGVWMRYGDGSLLSTNTFRANEAPTNGGGGLYIDQSHAILEDNTIVSNIAFDGGGLYLSGREITLTANTVMSNTALIGGGLSLYFNDSTLTENTISFNRATLDNGEGGGVLLRDSDPMLMRNTITFNYADWGGGLSIFRSSPALINTLIAENTSGEYGSGLIIRHNSSPRLWHSTIARNGGGDGNGVLITHGGCSVVMTNTILISQTLGISVSLDDAVTLVGTLWYSNTTDWGGEGTIITGTHNYWGDPRFNADGYHLMLGSAAIDRGVNAGVTTDIDGEHRPQGLAPDLGADEYTQASSFYEFFLPFVAHKE